MEKLLLSDAEAAHLLGVGRTFLRDRIRAGEIAYVKVGRLTRIPIEEVHRYRSALIRSSPCGALALDG
jgi:excisionase family DNA binding protein